CALALAFPKFNAAWLAPVGAAGLFWLWQRLSWKRAFWTGWFAGTIFFCITFSWFGFTVGAFVGNFAFLIVIIPALVEGLYVGAAAALAALAFKRAPAAFAPLAAAAAFTIMEWVRSIGVVGVPFGQLGYTQADTPLGLFAAYGGTYGVTFVICVLGAFLAQAIVRGKNRELLIAVGSLAAVWCLCFLAWPARQAPPASIRVAAIQGNIPQSEKSWSPAALHVAADRYVALTEKARSYQPQLVVWPETVMTTTLDDITRPYNVALSKRLASLARSLNTTLVTGSLDAHDGQYYNASYVYSPHGLLTAVYDKRQMVPFAESFPAKAYLSWLPYTNLITGFGTGTVDGVYDAGGVRFAPLICWESAFSDLAHAQVRNGAEILVVSTDDAWFGESSGPYQHSQIAQMRAIETGEWLVRAASTGISGIIAPDGRYVEHTDLDRQAVVLGMVGLPPGSLFARIGPTPVMLLLIALYLTVIAYRRRDA
ncbi:MAG: apolipoprotein N-acyltransferase, partial [Candidatus Eremiobacteraeota bacterium]|nr:apolipoprotein N-acyltransferase [Candidatus Eremiobacteraeota bacterium]